MGGAERLSRRPRRLTHGDESAGRTVVIRARARIGASRRAQDENFSRRAAFSAAHCPGGSPVIRLLALGCLSLLALVAPSAARAECAVYAEWIDTPEVEGPTPRIVVTVYGSDRADGRMGDAPLPGYELISERGRRVALTAEASHRGMTQVQIVLVPVAAVAPGHYTVRRLTKPRWGDHEAHALTVKAPAERLPSLAAPALAAQKSVRIEYGCGPAENLKVGVDMDGLYFVTLARAADSPHTPQTGFVAAVSDTGAPVLSIGHGMCNGEFALVDGARYEVTVRRVLPNGTLSSASTTTLTYGPHPE